jgi:TonB family protein
MSISGTVKIEVVVAPNGTVKDARIVGGHPVLASAALDAAREMAL